MKRRQIAQWLALVVTTGLTTIACSNPQSTPDPRPTNPAASAPVNLTVSAAASVQDALKEVQTAYQAVAPTVTITYNFGSSGSLAQQIIQGAPTDVFLSASKKWMTDLETKGKLLEGSRQDLLKNSMVLIVPKDKATITDFKDLTTAAISKVAIGEPDSVPAGQYAKEVLISLNLFEPLQTKLVFGKDVRQVLSYVETGNVDAGLVYATDAQISDQVKIVATAPSETHAPIIYPVAVVKDSTNAKAAQAFIDFLSSDTAIAIFQRYGFAMVNE